jgi:hypothetical protein
MSSVYQKYFNPKAIELAFHRVQCWTDKTVKDYVGLKAFGANLTTNANNLSESILQGKYAPQQGFKFYVPKSSKTLRTKTMLKLEDAIVYQAIANRIAELNQPKLTVLEDFVFGSVLSNDVIKGTAILDEEEPNYFFFKYWKSLFQKFKLSVLDSIEEDKVKYKFETDITGFFDCIPHYNLLSTLSNEFGVEDEILDLLSDCFNVWSGTKDSMTPGVGIPQGTLPSFFFANLILHKLDDTIISNGYKYYRYMDDIHIYGYTESELVEALLIIDKYTKGNGLSINSKKTSIQKINKKKEKEEVKDDIKKYGKVSLFSEGIENDFQDLSKYEIKKSTKKSELNVNKVDETKLSEQDQDLNLLFWGQNITTLTDEKEIKQFWLEKFNEVETMLPSLFKNPHAKRTQLKLKSTTEDIDFIRLGAQYTASYRALVEWGEDVKLRTDFVKYWLFAYGSYFWRANNIGITLSLYPGNQEIKETLIQFYSRDLKPYEWVKYFMIITLSYNQDYEELELRKLFFKWLKEEDSNLVKISLYRLLFKHSKNKQFESTLKKELQNETSIVLKLLIADFNRNLRIKDMDMVEFINTIGL